MKNISQTQIEQIVRNAFRKCNGTGAEWIETEQLFTTLYGDTYLKIKRKICLEGNGNMEMSATA